MANFLSAFSREFLGETPTQKDKLTIFSVTTVLLALIGYYNSAELTDIALWQSILFMLMAFDIIAGAIGNFTKSSQQWYKNKPKKRVMFLFEHFIHIGLLVLAVGHAWYCFGLLAFTIVAGLFVNYTETLKQQEINAASVILIGLVIFYVVFPAPPLLAWLPSIFLLKLVMGFSVRRER
ncbi:hypothetical protein [Thalassomonas sp. RHCl1]|uniref:hypothetical protein n=1 Tax=Thalassomonas sp. RHCl1 TaxID=2995320 RepID=UPI00248C2218|nr:hypothetical protein [Thalassomonas sp. RHCl1]